MGKYGFGRIQLQDPESLEVMTVREELDVVVKNGGESTASPYRAATPGQQALWKAVQHANPHGISPGGIARELGISRNTVHR